MFIMLPELQAAAAIVLTLFACLAGYGAGALAYGKSALELRRTAQSVLLLVAVTALLAAGAAVLTVCGYYALGWNEVSDKALLFLLLFLLPAAAVGKLAVPRLLWFIRMPAERKERESMLSRTKRRAASEGQLVVPLQSLAAGTVIYTYRILNPEPGSQAAGLLIADLILAAVTAVLILRQHIKRKRIHRDSGTAFVHRMKRTILYTITAAVVPIGLMAASGGKNPDQSAMPQARLQTRQISPTVDEPVKEHSGLTMENAVRTGSPALNHNRFGPAANTGLIRRE